MAVQFKFTGDDKDVARALERMEKKYNALIAATKKGTDETKKMADAAKKAFDDTRTPMERYKAKLEELRILLKQGAIDAETFGRASKKAADELGKADKSSGGMVANALKSVAALTSVSGVLATINNELQRKIELEKASADKQAERAKLTREALINLGTASPAERKEIFSGIAGISTRTGVKQSDLLASLPGLTSGQGGLDTKGMLGAAEMAARIAPHDLETMSSVALGLENTASLTGTSDMAENMGFQLGLGRRSQVKSLKGINEYVIPGAIGVKGHGGSAEEAAAFVTALGIGMKDSEGRVQSTAGSSAAKQLADFLPMLDTYKWDEHGRRKLDRRGTGLASNDERIAYMRANEEARMQFMAQGSFEQRAFIPTRDILTPGTEVARMYDVVKNEIPKGKAAALTTKDFISTLETDAGQVDAASVRGVEAGVEKMQIGNEAAQRMTIARDALRKGLDAGGAGWMESMMQRANFEITPGDPEDVALSGLERQRGMMKNNKATALQIEGINDVINELKAIKANQKNRDPNRHAE